MFGHSMGGFVALTAGRDYGSSLRGVAAIDSPVRELSAEAKAWIAEGGHGDIPGTKVYPDRETILSRFRTLPEDTSTLSYVKDHIAEGSIVEVEDGWTWKFDPHIFLSSRMEPEELAAIDCEVALIRGERGMATTDITDLVAERLGGHVPVTLIPDAGHHIMLDQPVALIAVLQTLLGQWRQHMTESVLIDTADGVLTITWNEPDRLNALTADMLNAAAAAIEDAPADTRLVVITGTGRAFSSGAALGADFDGSATLDGANRLVRAMTRSPLPVISAVNGIAAGVGCSIAIAADITLAKSSGYFLLAFVNIGLMPDGGATELVAASVGRARANRMAMLGEKLPADEAAEIGLIYKSLGDDDYDAELAKLDRQARQRTDQGAVGDEEGHHSQHAASARRGPRCRARGPGRAVLDGRCVRGWLGVPREAPRRVHGGVIVTSDFETLDRLLTNRRSCRGFTDEQVPREVIEQAARCRATYGVVVQHPAVARRHHLGRGDDQAPRRAARVARRLRHRLRLPGCLHRRLRRASQGRRLAAVRSRRRDARRP